MGCAGCAVHKGPASMGAPKGIIPEIDFRDDRVHKMMSQAEPIF